MSETTKPRPIVAVPQTVEEQKTEENKQEQIAQTVEQNNEVVPVPSQDNQVREVEQNNSLPFPRILDRNESELSDSEWEKVIEAAKAKQETEPAVREIPVLPSEDEGVPPFDAHTPDDDALEAEIERRVNERIAAKKKEEEQKVVEAAKAEEAKKNAELDNKHDAVATKYNASGLIFVNLGDDTDFENAVAREFDDDVRPDSEKTRDPSEYASGMSLIRELGQRTQQQKLMKDWITELLKNNPDALKQVDDKLRVNKIVPKIGDGTGPKKLSGSAAKAAVISRMKGMFRIQLYNSGFWIDICPPSLVDIDNWMQEVDQEFKEIGRTLGGHAHTVIDVFLKQKLCEILPTIIQRSNYENVDDKNALMKNISFHDYDTILWGLCCSMYKDGVGIGVYCTNPDCRYIDNKQYLDIARLCYLNTAKFPPAAIEWMMSHAHNSSKLLTDTDLADYREKLLGFTKTVSVDKGMNVYELAVPSLLDFVERGATLVGKIASYTNGEKNIHTDIITNQLTFHLYKMLLPWIKSLSINDAGGNLIYKIEDKDAIYESLDINTFEESNFYKSVSDFIEDTKLAFFAAHTLKCPKCGKTAELDKDNLFPLDLQYLFFGLCCLQMNQTGASF